MENQNPEGSHPGDEIHKNKNKSSNMKNPQNLPRRGSNTHFSMSDTESQLDSFHSPLRFDSPSPSPNSKALVTLDNYFSPLHSPRFPLTPATPPPTKKPPEMVSNFSRGGGAREGVKKVEKREGGVGGGERKTPSREVTMMKLALGFRICQLVLCLLSFSVMAADRTRGWAGDSFDRYKEYRYSLAVNVIGFVYSGFQAFNSACYLASGKHIPSHYLHYHFEFLMDQILAYLLMSASSSAATRVDDWVSNWGKDTFTEMATASVGMSFLAFFAFAISSLISGYNLCNRG